MLMRFDPFREVDRLFEQLSTPGRPVGMPMDAYRRGDSFVVHFDLPGVDPGSIDLTVEKNALNVKSERRWNRAEGDEIIVTERPQGTFTRQLFLGEGLDYDKIEARYDNGVLTLTIPVAETAKPRKVEVTAGAGNGQQAIDVGASAS
jgi:HSP20 family protein